MRFYNSDGSFVEDLTDTDFGWCWSGATEVEIYKKIDEIPKKILLNDQSVEVTHPSLEVNDTKDKVSNVKSSNVNEDISESNAELRCQLCERADSEAKKNNDEGAKKKSINNLSIQANSESCSETVDYGSRRNTNGINEYTMRFSKLKKVDDDPTDIDSDEESECCICQTPADDNKKNIEEIKVEARELVNSISNEQTFMENPDAEFGWYLTEIAEEERIKNLNNTNKDTKSCAPAASEVLVNLDINIAQVRNSLSTALSLEGNLCKEEPRDLEHEKKQVASTINPCNAETRMLLAIISFSKYKSLVKREATEELVQSVNFKHNRSPLSREIYENVMESKKQKEDCMLSLMMELVLADANSSLSDLVGTDKVSTETVLPEFLLNTSDLGKSIASTSRSSNSCDKTCSDFSDRSNILSSIGLGDEDRSIQSFCEQTLEMRSELAEIRKSFQAEEARVKYLIKAASALENELRETLYLDDILHLLNGDIEKVKLKKLPFRVFYKEAKEGDDVNLII